MADPEKGEKPLGESEAISRPILGESVGVRLEEWRVRKSSVHLGMGELFIRDRAGKELHVVLDFLTAYDLSDKLLDLAASLKSREGT